LFLLNDFQIHQDEVIVAALHTMGFNAHLKTVISGGDPHLWVGNYPHDAMMLPGYQEVFLGTKDMPLS
jgi:hypothetical protein